MARDELDPLDDELRPKPEIDPVLPEETAFNVSEAVEAPSEAGDVETNAGEPVDLEQASVES